MGTWIILTIVMIWFVLPAFLIISACIHSSRLSRAEEAAQASRMDMRHRQADKSHSPSPFSEMPRGAETLRVPLQVGDGLD